MLVPSAVVGTSRARLVSLFYHHDVKSSLLLWSSAAAAAATGVVALQQSDARDCCTVASTTTKREDWQHPFSLWLAGFQNNSIIRATSTNPTLCDTSVPSQSPPSVVKLQRRMTAIGHFAVASETKFNPSIITFVMRLKDDITSKDKEMTASSPPLTAHEFCQLWRDKQMGEYHPRFHQTVCPSRGGDGWRFVDDTAPDTLTKHVSETVYPVNRLELRNRLQYMQLNRWDLQDSLWHVAIAGKEPLRTRQTSSTDSVNDDSSFNVAVSAHSQTDSTDSMQLPNPSSSETLLFFRGHHALADGASMGAALADLFDESEILRDQKRAAIDAFRRHRLRTKNIFSRWWNYCRKILMFVFGSFLALLLQINLFWCQFWDADPWKQVKQASTKGVQRTTTIDHSDPAAIPPRTLSWTDVAAVEQVKWVADTLSKMYAEGGQGERMKMTVNDVFVSCITAALARQLQHHRQRLQETQKLAIDGIGDENRGDHNSLPRQKFMHVAVPVHLKGGMVLPGESVGNNIGAFVARVPGERVEKSLSKGDSSPSDSVDRLYAVSSELQRVKCTPAAFLSHGLARCLSYATSVLPLSWIAPMYAAANAGSLVVVSNNRGTPTPVHLAGRRLESIYGFVPLPPGIPIGVVVMSYAGKMSCTLTAEPWAIPDGDQFMVWMLEEYLSLLAAAKAAGS